MEKSKSKRKAVGILFILGSILVLIATWDMSDSAFERAD